MRLMDADKVITLLQCMANKAGEEAMKARKDGDNIKVACCDGEAEAYDVAINIVEGSVVYE